MQLNKIIQKDYTSFSLYYQIKLPLDLEISIPSDDPVRLVSAFVEEMDLSELYKTYGRIRKNQATPRQMLKLVIYATMNRIHSFAVTYVRLLLESLLFPCFQAFLFLKISHVLLAFYIVLRYNKYYTKRNACHVPQKNT